MTYHPPSADVEHQYSFDLLPWWVNGTLDDAAQERISAHVQHCLMCREEIDLLESCINTVEADPIIPPNVESALARVNRRIDKSRSGTLAEWFRKLVEPGLLTGQGRGFALATVAVLLLLALAPLRFGLDTPEKEGDYTVLSSPEAPVASIELEIVFADATRADGILGNLPELADAAISEHWTEVEPRRYRIRLRAAVDPQTLHELMNRLDQQPSVQSVELKSD